MFHFFQKKLFLKDLLEGFVDIHCHILPGIDDGASNITESLDLIDKLTQLGVSQFVATPHVMQDFYPNTDETIGDAFQSLIEAVSSSSKLSNIVINPAAEYMMDEYFEDHVLNNNLFTLKKNIVLVEISYFQAPINLEDIIRKIKKHGYKPVLAHPERYLYYHNNKEYYHRLKQLGCDFQLNLLSLSDYYGTNVQKKAQYLIDEKLIDFVGTDTHNLKHIEKLTNIKLSKTLYKNLEPLIQETNHTFSVI
ncbi:histidinol phosphatase [Pseudalgibacter alginicilyticus]|uniref:protein-tyrosine-phosphatase n=1 Tax=Pseudalgibacter alginicilyticus TaxID=1736674 RepID=A0A0P0D8I2_9FLAO|nr:CpsB/CapC family capsule biosynthesis tyrosine phosphatase [Pseudalgibacter alginicilyticus]ALJ04017.1 histidinol phosphatase [Pseudalgibacter alginicilyticus]